MKNITLFFHTKLLLVILLVSMLVSCNTPMSTPSTLTKVTLRLDWLPGTQHAPFYLGQEKGYYAEEGIDLEIISGSGSGDSVKYLGTRTVDLALVDALVLVQAREQQVPIKAVAVYYQRTPITVISPASKPLKTPQDLVGKKIGAKKGTANYLGLIALLEANNINQEQLQIVDTGFGVQPLLVGQVDAMMGFSYNEPIQAESAGMAVYNLLIADFGVSAYGLTIAANEEFIRDKSDILKEFLRATKRAMDDSVKDRQSAVDALVKVAPDTNIDQGLKVLDDTIPLWKSSHTDTNGYGWQSEVDWQQTIDLAYKLKLVQDPPQSSDVFTNDFLK